DIANLLRRSKKPIFLTVNKIDTPEKTALIADFYSLSLGNPYPVSAMHGTGGMGDLLDEVIKVFPEFTGESEGSSVKIALIGRPNVGKSSLLNSLLGKERVIVSDVSGTTRDTIDTEVKHEGKIYTLIDTAGIRKKAKVDYGIEKFAVTRSIKAIRDCNVAIVLIEAAEGLTDQDKKIANMVIEDGKALIIAVNKWDLIENKDSATINRFTEKIRDDAPFLNFAPIVFISAKEKQRIFKLFSMADEVYSYAKKEISTNLLTKIILEAFNLSPPTSEKGKRLRAYYSTQVGSEPPTFVLFINNAKLIKDNYKRYLEKKLREAFGFFGTPIRLIFRERHEKK
ncbi:MAG: ribosome biogenesis GTPase Der, partial [Candidatus Gastranaerophilales bacterium]|nr:ribosome biogenesis GTPase Der [Candidatus Gastranaerophilales bacterium]